MQWAGDDGAKLVSAISSSVASISRPPKQRRCGQAYESVVQYFTADEWLILQENNPGGAKLRVIFDTLYGLGLRCPTEPTLKFVCSLWMYLDLNEAELRRMTPQNKGTMLQHVKSEFQRGKSGLPDAVEHLACLPQRPLELLSKLPLLYQAHFQDRMPIEPPINIQMVRELDMGYSCRNGGSTTPTAARGSAPTLNVGSGSLESSAVERVASMFMDKMEGLQTMQQQMMTLVMGGSRMPGGNLREMSLEYLPGSRRLSMRRLPNTTFAPPMTPLRAVMPPPIEEVDESVGSSTAALRQSPLLRQSPPSGSRSPDAQAFQSPLSYPAGSGHPAGQAALAVKAEQGDSPANDDGARLLDALLERENEKKAKAKEDKAAAKVAAKAAAKTPAEGAQSSSAITGELQHDANAPANGAQVSSAHAKVAAAKAPAQKATPSKCRWFDNSQGIANISEATLCSTQSATDQSFIVHYVGLPRL